MQGLDLLHVPEGHLERLRSLLTKFDDMRAGHLDEISITSRRINLEPGAQTVKLRPYQTGPTTSYFAANEVERTPETEGIEPATSEWASPRPIVPKHAGSYHMCIDYRELNAVIMRDTHPLSRANEFNNSLRMSQFLPRWTTAGDTGRSL